MLRFFRKRKEFDDNKQQIFIDEISMMLKIQMVVVPDDILEDAKGNINSLALGYLWLY